MAGLRPIKSKRCQRLIKNLMINIFVMSFVFVIFIGFLESLFLLFPESIDYLTEGRVHYYDPDIVIIAL